jgi:hypothetical protein
MITVKDVQNYFSCSERTAWTKLNEIKGLLGKRDVHEFEFFKAVKATPEMVCYVFGREKASRYREALGLT